MSKGKLARGHRLVEGSPKQADKHRPVKGERLQTKHQGAKIARDTMNLDLAPDR